GLVGCAQVVLRGRPFHWRAFLSEFIQRIAEALNGFFEQSGISALLSLCCKNVAEFVLCLGPDYWVLLATDVLSVRRVCQRCFERLAQALKYPGAETVLLIISPRVTKVIRYGNLGVRSGRCGHLCTQQADGIRDCTFHNPVRGIDAV